PNSNSSNPPSSSASATNASTSSPPHLPTTSPNAPPATDLTPHLTPCGETSIFFFYCPPPIPELWYLHHIQYRLSAASPEFQNPKATRKRRPWQPHRATHYDPTNSAVTNCWQMFFLMGATHIKRFL